MRKNDFKATVSEVTCLLLVSGYPVLGRVCERSEEGVSITRPITINLSQVGPQQISMDIGTLNPLFTVLNPEAPILIKNQHIMFEFEPTRQLIEKYTEVTSGIKIASTQETAAVKQGATPPGFEVAKR